jgi:hypothetical protein
MPIMVEDETNLSYMYHVRDGDYMYVECYEGQVSIGFSKYVFFGTFSRGR